MVLKNSVDLNKLSLNELIVLYFDTMEEVNSPHAKFDGFNPIQAKKNYIDKHRQQGNIILGILKGRNHSVNYFYLKFKQLKIKLFS